MKTRVLLAITLFPFLFSCAPPKPEIPRNEVPAAPLVRALELRSRSFTGLKAVARVETERKGRKRVYESVAFLQKGMNRLRIEGFGPLGESIFALVWDGKDMLVRLPGDAEPMRTGQWGFERLVGFPLAPEELSALLSGNAPQAPADAEARAFCTGDGRCEVELRHQESRWRVFVAPSEPFRIESCERYHRGTLAYSARFDAAETVDGYLFPKRVTVKNADNKVSLTIDYQDVEVNVPVEDSLFVLGIEGAVR